VIIKREGKQVDVCDKDCKKRPCFSLLQDKGAFTPGRGYHYYKDAASVKWVCGRRHLHGCPDPLPAALERIPPDAR
jgi:hypothetical protein